MSKIESYDVVPVEGCEPSMGLMAAMLNDATREWRGEIPEVPDEAVVWQPFEGGPSIGAVLWHMVAVEIWWMEHVAAGKALDPVEMKRLRDDETRVDKVQWPPAEARPFAEYLELQDASRVRTLATIATLDEPRRTVVWKDKWEFTLRWILNHVVGHESYHGGQIVLLKTLWDKR